MITPFSAFVNTKCRNIPLSRQNFIYLVYDIVLASQIDNNGSQSTGITCILRSIGLFRGLTKCPPDTWLRSATAGLFEPYI